MKTGPKYRFSVSLISNAWYQHWKSYIGGPTNIAQKVKKKRRITDPAFNFVEQNYKLIHISLLSSACTWDSRWSTHLLYSDSLLKKLQLFHLFEWGQSDKIGKAETQSSGKYTKVRAA